MTSIEGKTGQEEFNPVDIFKVYADELRDGRSHIRIFEAFANPNDADFDVDAVDPEEIAQACLYELETPEGQDPNLDFLRGLDDIGLGIAIGELPHTKYVEVIRHFAMHESTELRKFAAEDLDMLTGISLTDSLDLATTLLLDRYEDVRTVARQRLKLAGFYVHSDKHGGLVGATILDFAGVIEAFNESQEIDER